MRPFDPDFGTAAQAVDAMRRGAISSRELTAHVFDRIRRHNGAINAFVTLVEDGAMARAAEADDARAREQSWGPLHGLPIVVKDAFETAGVRTTSGSTKLASYVPRADAVVVSRLTGAGAIVVGKTNLPEFAADWQSFNDVAGTSNNPWDVTRTPGGSTGGGAAALAAGMGFLEIGSDLAGSIRIPSHFCGVYGHKPSLGVVPLRGHIPPPPGTPVIPLDLPVAGPLARSADDLRLALEIVGGPDTSESRAYQWTLPGPRQASLRDYRIGYVIDDPFCPVDAPMKQVLAAAMESLRRAGAQLVEGWPAGVDPARQHATYSWLLAAFFSLEVPDQGFKGMQAAVAAGAADPWTQAMAASHRDWLRRSGERLVARTLWQEYFKTHDAFLMPASFISAFPHDHREMRARTLKTSDGAERRYDDITKWIAIATLAGCPVTVAPIGLTAAGLPVGVQIMGPYLEDATPIDIAMRMADVTGSFAAPPAFQR